MPDLVSQRTQQLDVAYAILRQLVTEAIGQLDTSFHVLSAASMLVHAAYLDSTQRDREASRPADDPVDNPF